MDDEDGGVATRESTNPELARNERMKDMKVRTVMSGTMNAMAVSVSIDI